MSECPTTDAILAIGDALSWEFAEGVHHLHTCDECRAQIEVLRLTRTGFAETEPVDPEVVRRISAALTAAARSEKSHVRERQRWINVIEAVMAGIAALIILVSSGIRIESDTAAVLGFALGATLMILGRMLARSVPLLGHEAAQVWRTTHRLP